MIVVVQHGERLAGLLVDSVQETFVVDESLLQSPPDIQSKTGPQFVDAILPLDGRLLSRLVVAALFPDIAQLAA